MPGDLIEIEAPSMGLRASLWATPDSSIVDDAVGYFSFGLVLGTYEEPIISEATGKHEGNYDSWLFVIDSRTERVGWLVSSQVRPSK